MLGCLGFTGWYFFILFFHCCVTGIMKSTQISVVCGSQIKIMVLENFNSVYLLWKRVMGLMEVTRLQLSFLNWLDGKSEMP
jgi:hypothetical protein